MQFLFLCFILSSISIHNFKETEQFCLICFIHEGIKHIYCNRSWRPVFFSIFYTIVYIHICFILSCITLLTKMCIHVSYYGVATVSKLLKNVGLFCRIQSLLQKRLMHLRSLLIVATSYRVYVYTHFFYICVYTFVSYYRAYTFISYYHLNTFYTVVYTHMFSPIMYTQF